MEVGGIPGILLPAEVGGGGVSDVVLSLLKIKLTRMQAVCADRIYLILCHIKYWVYSKLDSFLHRFICKIL